MKRTDLGPSTVLLVIVLLVTILPGVLFSQENASDREGWKERFGSPTYGVSFATLILTYHEDSQYNEGEEAIVVPGVEMRIYNGTNVARRGGFYTGYEVGTTFYFLSESESVSAFMGGTEYTDYHISDLFSGLVFIMSKYGYRIDLGTETGGMSIGPQIGIGLGMGGGSADIVNDVTGESTGADTDMVFGPMLEAMVEAAFRLGQNFRLLGVVGASVSPMMEWDGQDSGGEMTVNGEFFPVRPNIRLGFALNY